MLTTFRLLQFVARVVPHLIKHTSFAATLCIFALDPRAHGQSFEELKASEAYRKLESTESKTRNNNQKKRAQSLAAMSSYESLWQGPRGAHLLLQWAEARIANFQLEVFTAGYKQDHVGVEAFFKNRQRGKVTVTIQVPDPLYKEMAMQRTLASFNRFRPPALDVVGSQKVEIQGIQADYFRHSKGACSLLIPIEQAGIINLEVSSCTQSSLMFDVAKSLNLERLNQKLRS